MLGSSSARGPLGPGARGILIDMPPYCYATVSETSGDFCIYLRFKIAKLKIMKKCPYLR